MTESGEAGSPERYGVPRVGLRPLLAGHRAGFGPMTGKTRVVGRARPMPASLRSSIPYPTRLSGPSSRSMRNCI
jgi:hypothetical protein